MPRLALTGPALLILAALVVVLAVFCEVAAFRYALTRMGLARWAAYVVLGAALLGSRVDLPVGHLHCAGATVLVVRHGIVVGRLHGTRTLLAVNLGGAFVPCLLCAYLLSSGRGAVLTLLALVPVTLVVHAFARPIPGVGIAVPTLLPPAAAALATLLVRGGRDGPRIAYVAGTLGVLVGADVLNLPTIPALGASVASIGGAGTSDGVFVTGVLAALLVASASAIGRRLRAAGFGRANPQQPEA